MAIYKLIANGSFGPDEIEVMKAAYEAALIDVGVTDRDDPINVLIAKSIINVTATGEQKPNEIMERALNEAFVGLCSAIPLGPKRGFRDGEVTAKPARSPPSFGMLSRILSKIECTSV